VGSAIGSLPAAIVLPTVVIAGFVGGAIWGIVPALLKSRFRTNEIVTTLMMNYIAMYLLFYLVHGPWKEPTLNYPWSWRLPAAAVLPGLGGGRIHAGVLLALVALVAVYVLDHHTFWGYEIRFIGANRRAAEGAGINISRSLILLMAVSGGLAGLAGMGEVCGLRLRLLEEISLGYGFTAITAALLGRLEPISVAISSVFLAFLAVGGQYVQRAMNIPYSFIEAISALLVLGVLLGRLLTEYQLVTRQRGAQANGN
jgi:simple sugar transport system permease protein